MSRAILKRPQILILDEATSNLDTESEQLIQASMASLLAGRTTFVIAHRLSTIRRADTILLMDDGRVVERGTDAELMAAGPVPCDGPPPDRVGRARGRGAVAVSQHGCATGRPGARTGLDERA